MINIYCYDTTLNIQHWIKGLLFTKEIHNINISEIFEYKIYCRSILAALKNILHSPRLKDMEKLMIKFIAEKKEALMLFF